MPIGRSHCLVAMDAADSDYEAVTLASGATSLSAGVLKPNGAGSQSGETDSSSITGTTGAVNQVNIY